LNSDELFYPDLLVWIDAKFADGHEKTHVKIAMAKQQIVLY